MAYGIILNLWVIPSYWDITEGVTVTYLDGTVSPLCTTKDEAFDTLREGENDGKILNEEMENLMVNIRLSEQLPSDFFEARPKVDQPGRIL
jgi:hypothetical protein